MNDISEKSQNEEMKQKKKKWLLLSSLLFLSLVVVAAAILIPIALTRDSEDKLKVIDLYFERVEASFDYDEDVLSTNLIVVYEDKTQSAVKLVDAISEADKQLLSSVGTHSVTLSYRGFSKEVSVTIEPKEYTDAEIEAFDAHYKEYSYSEEGYPITLQNIPQDASVIYYVNGLSISEPETYVVDAPGSYPITAVITRAGYEELTLTYTIKIIE